MPSSVTATARISNSGSAGTYTTEARSGYLNDALVRVFRKIAPTKTWATVAGVLGLTERVAKHRLAGTRVFTADELARLLQTEAGIDFLSACMAEAEPKWWVLFKSYAKHTTYKARQAKARRELEALIHESNALQAGEAALLFSDEGFHSPHFAAVRAASRAQNRPLDNRVARRK